MVTFVILLMTIIGAAFPRFLIKAIRSEEEETITNYTVLSCLCFAALVFLTGALINS